uniref:Uncharacterized protein n=1 Tax=Acrobeloides nanus TaxID=290746 RepID=A0A914EL48_9BILA
MQYAFIILLILVIVPYAYAQCSSTALAPGVWSPWAANGCSDTCGMCGLTQMIRICLVAGTCTGSSTMTSTTPCGTIPCPYPRNACCPGFAAGVSNGSIICIQSG